MSIMVVLLSILYLGLGSLWLDYRFGRDYGNYFFDYSLNGQYGINGNSAIDSKVISTDRGIYVNNDNNFVSIKGTKPFPNTFTIVTWFINSKIGASIFYYKDSSTSINICRGGSHNQMRVDINREWQQGVWDLFQYDNWILVIFSYSSNKFEGTINLKKSFSLSIPFSPKSGYESGLGKFSDTIALQLIMWNFAIYDTKSLGSEFYLDSKSSNCLIGICDSCSISIKDDFLGIGCLSSNSNLKENSYNQTNALNRSFTKTIKLNCTIQEGFCSYDFSKNICYTKDLNSSLTVNPITIAQCICKAPYVKRNSKCCSAQCKSCDGLDYCTECYASNSQYKLGNCECIKGYYSDGNFGNQSNCVSCNKGCVYCTSSLCIKCKDSNAEINGKDCQCKNGYYGSPLKCSLCPTDCPNCSTNQSCVTCKNEFAIEVDGSCICIEGYYGNGSSCYPCHESCKICNSSNICLLCLNNNTELAGDRCICNERSFGDASINCEPCDSLCKKCSSISICDECKVDSTNHSGICSCNYGFFKDIDKCSKCHDTCLDCINSKLCVKCVDNYAYNLEGRCICRAGYYLNDAGKCSMCGTGCSQCNSSSCNLCYNPNSLINGLDCDCPEGYFYDEFLLNCSLCEDGCKSCNETHCFECLTYNSSIDGNKCICNKGFWLDANSGISQTCKPCAEDCIKCDKLDNCQECIDEFAEFKIGNGCVCKKGFWRDEGNSSNCSACHEDCELCSSFDNCQKCKDDSANLNSDHICIKLCSNSSNEFENCTKCPPLCTSCTLDLICIDCVNNSVKINNLCRCGRGYYELDSKCELKYFNSTLKVSKSNKLFLLFSEPISINLTTSSMIILLNNNPINFSLSKIKSTTFVITSKLFLSIAKESIIKLSLNKLLYSELDSQLSEYELNATLFPISTKDLSALELGIINGLKIAITIALILCLLSNPSTLWSIINTIQLLIFMPLNSIPYPDKLNKMSQTLIEYNLMPNIFSKLFESNCTSEVYDRAKEFGIGSSVFFLNCGKIIATLTYLISGLTFGGIFAKSYLQKLKFEELKLKNQFNVLIRFWIQGYLEIGLYSMIQLKSEITYPITGSICMCTAVMFGGLFIITPWLFTILLSYQDMSVNNSQFRIKYASILEEFKIDKGFFSALFYPLYFCRRLIYTVTQVFLIEYRWIQGYSNFIFSVIFLFYLFKIKPYKDNLSFCSAIISELCISTVFFSATLFLMCEENEKIKTIENICIYAIFSSVCIQLILGFISFYLWVKKLYIKYKGANEMNMKINKNANQKFYSTDNH